MGSSYFYLEFLLAWLCLLKASGHFQNPAIFALEYTLVPDACYPTQLHEAIAGYKHVLSIIQDPSKICVSGDSAGGTLILSMLLHFASLSNISSAKIINRHRILSGKRDRSMLPGMAILISPWVTLQSPLDKVTLSDYLHPSTLHAYASQYAGPRTPPNDPLISPGNCKSVSWWRKASPKHGFLVTYGAEEVFAPEIEQLIEFWEEGGLSVKAVNAEGGIHAWPVAALFLSSTGEERTKGLKVIVQSICEKMGRLEVENGQRAKVLNHYLGLVEKEKRGG
jgi:acetyl esterase/lipase